MIALIHHGRIVSIASSAGGTIPALFGLGYTLEDGTLLTAGGEPAALPSNPVQPVTLGEGISIVPVVELDEPAPEGKVLAGRESVVLADRVELRPVWEDAPAQPSLDDAKAAALKEIRSASEAVRASYYPTGKEIDIRRLAPGYTQEHLSVLDGFLDGTLNPVSFQAASEIETAPDLAALQEIMTEYRALYGQELA